jgi:DNA-binding NtrC family response regulator
MNLGNGLRVVLWGPQDNGLELLGESLACRGFRVQAVNSFEELSSALEAQEVDLIVARLCRRFHAPLELLGRLQSAPAAPPVLVVTGEPDLHLYLEAMRRGAFDCVALPLNQSELVRIVSRALEARTLQAFAGGGTK